MGQRGPGSPLGVRAPAAPAPPLSRVGTVPAGPGAGSPALTAGGGGGRVRRSGRGRVRLRRGGPEKQAGAAEKGSGSRRGGDRGARREGRRARGAVEEDEGSRGGEGAGTPRGGRGRGAGAGTPGPGPWRGRRRGGGCGRAGSPVRPWPGRSGCGYIMFPNLLSEGSGQGGWQGGRGGRTSLNWPGNSRGRGPGEMGCCPAPSILATPGNFSVNPPRLFYSPPTLSQPHLLPPSLPPSSPVALPPLSSTPLPSPLRVDSCEESVSQREAPSSYPQLSPLPPSPGGLLCVLSVSLSLHLCLSPGCLGYLEGAW